MDSFKVILDSGNPREGPISTMPQHLHSVLRNEQPGGSDHFFTSTQYMLWESGCTHSINLYFDLYTELKNLDKRDDAEVNDIGGIIKSKGIGSIALHLKDDTGEIHKIIFKIYTRSLGRPSSSSSLKNGHGT